MNLKKPSPKKAAMTSPWKESSKPRISAGTQVVNTDCEENDFDREDVLTTPLRSKSSPSDKQFDSDLSFGGSPPSRASTFNDLGSKGNCRGTSAALNINDKPMQAVDDLNMSPLSQCSTVVASASSVKKDNLDISNEFTLLKRQNADLGLEPSPSNLLQSCQSASSNRAVRNLFSKEKEKKSCCDCSQANFRNSVGINEVSRKCDLILMNLGRVSRSMLPNERRITIPPNMPSIPLGSKKDLNNYETFLGKSDINIASVCDYMSSFVRTSVENPERKSAHNILAHLLTNNFAKDINLDGGNGKIAFRALNLYKVFQGTLQTAFPNSDLDIADDALKRWLKDAKWRKQPSAAK